MYHSTKYVIACPCGMVFHSRIYEYVNTRQDPQLRYAVLAGSLNVSTCPNCGRSATHARPFIYSDPEHSLLVYVDPSSDISEEARRLTLEKLRAVHQEVGIEVNYRFPHEEKSRGGERGRGVITYERQQGKGVSAPPLHVVFGLDQLQELINASLSQQERLGRLALRTDNPREAERGQLCHMRGKVAPAI